MFAAERGRVLRVSECKVDGAEARFNHGLHDRVWGTHNHGLLLLLLGLHLWRRAVCVRGLSGAVRVSVRHGCRRKRGRSRERTS